MTATSGSGDGGGGEPLVGFGWSGRRRRSGFGCSSSLGKMYADLAEERSLNTVTMVLGVAPAKGGFEGFEMAEGAENGGCKCGSSCTCDPCNCK